MKKLNLQKPATMTDDNFALLQEALDYLSPKQRLVVYLRFWDNMTIQEIAKYIGHSWEATDRMIDFAINHLRLRIIQLNHEREECVLLNHYQTAA